MTTATKTTAPGAPIKLPFACGACASGLHNLCPGATYNPATGGLAYCPCEQHVTVRCTRCGHHNPEGEYTATHGTCTDIEGCMGRAAARTGANPTYAMVQECLNTRVEAGEVVERKRRPTPQQREAARAQRQARKVRDCECSCGGQTKGGAFLPGHDARLLAQLAEQVKQTPITRADEAVVRAKVTERLEPFPALLAKFNKRMGWK
ncbi:MAG TPA: hypothetical protein VFT75_18385 [Nocardioidaceae bacterium]|nr:hypothetical protein [Nocardioidaceae bacterium]